MAKGKSFFGLKKGSTKSLTFQVLQGQQIVKDRVFEVKNPRTRAQMVQRMCMATVTAAYQHMHKIVDHSFEGVTYGQDSMSAFIRANIQDLINDVNGDFGQFSYNPFQDRSLYPSPFIMSRGSLKLDTTKFAFSNVDELVELSFYYPSGITVSSTMKELCDAMGWRVGDMLTFVFVYNNATFSNWSFGWVRMKICYVTDKLLYEGSFESHCEITSNLELTQTAISDRGEKFSFVPAATGGDECFGTVILSRHSNGRWLRSSSSIIFPGSPVNSPTATEALATYPQGAAYILNGGSKGRSGGLIPGKVIPDGYVDLGLPSGTLWARGNIVKDGDTYAIGEETDYGCYFSWGNVDGHNEGDGYDFSEDEYNSTPGASLTADIQPTDTAHDAAAACIGGGAHMPTKEQLIELLDSTDTKWTSINGVSGRLAMNKDDHSKYIFLPASGMYCEDILEKKSEYGNYFTGAKMGGEDDLVWYLFFDNMAGGVSDSSRFVGCSVRPVLNL